MKVHVMKTKLEGETHVPIAPVDLCIKGVFEADLLPYVNKRSGLQDPQVAFRRDLNERYLKSGTWLHLSTILMMPQRFMVTSVETGEPVTLSGNLSDYK